MKQKTLELALGTALVLVAACRHASESNPDGGPSTDPDTETTTDPGYTCTGDCVAYIAECINGGGEILSGLTCPDDQICCDFSGTDTDADADSDTDTGTDSETDSLSDGLVAFYPFNGNANDESGGNHGIVHGATLTEDRFQDPQSAYSFDGVNDYIDCGNGDSLKLTESLSISVWISIDGYSSGNQGVVSKYSGANPSSERAYTINLENQGTCPDQVNTRVANAIISADGSCVWYGSDTCSLVCGETELSLGQWHHLVGVFDKGQSLAMYVDGILDGLMDEAVVGTVHDSLVDMVIGCQYNAESSLYYFYGKIDDVRLYDRALGPQEVQALYQLGE